MRSFLLAKNVIHPDIPVKTNIFSENWQCQKVTWQTGKPFDNQSLVCASCPDSWLDHLYRSAEFEESSVNDTTYTADTVNTSVHLKHQCSVRFLLSRQKGVKGATSTLTTAKEVEKGTYHFGARDQAPTAFYTEGLSTRSRLTSLKREDLVKTSTQTASWIGRMGAVVHSPQR